MSPSEEEERPNSLLLSWVRLGDMGGEAGPSWPVLFLVRAMKGGFRRCCLALGSLVDQRIVLPMSCDISHPSRSWTVTS